MKKLFVILLIGNSNKHMADADYIHGSYKPVASPRGLLDSKNEE